MRAAVFDVDFTLIAESSMRLYVKYMIPRGEFSRWDLVRGSYYTLRYKLGLLDFESMADRASEPYTGRSEQELYTLCREWFAAMVKNYFYPEALALVERHRAQGDALALLSATSVYLLRAMADHLDIAHYYGTRMETVDGRFTGRMVRPLCYGTGKIHYAERLAEEMGISLSESYYYSDSITDLEVLERFGHPVAVNPDRLLARQARARGWPILHFARRGISGGWAVPGGRGGC